MRRPRNGNKGINIDELTPRVAAAVREGAERWELTPERVSARYVLNWGGFGGASFHVSDGRRRLHLKLANDSYGKNELRGWLRVHDLLEAFYHAPRIIGWLDIAGTSYGGLLFEHIDGMMLDSCGAPQVVARILERLDRLHADTALAARIVNPESPATSRDCFLAKFEEQYMEDLKLIAAAPPPFVSSQTLRWMQDESDLVLSMVRENSAFDGRTSAACHWDLWENNVLVDREERFWLLDWNGLDLGDPVVDYATLLWPIVSSGPCIDTNRASTMLDLDPTAERRLALYLRATALDWVIDVLADWIECSAVPQYREQVREQKQTDHLRCLELYRSTYR